MEKTLKMDEEGFTLQDLAALAVTGGAMLIEEFIKHPVGGVTAILGLLYMFDRWRTQRIIHKIKLSELEDIEKDERIIRDSKERKEGSKE